MFSFIFLACIFPPCFYHHYYFYYRDKCDVTDAPRILSFYMPELYHIFILFYLILIIFFFQWLFNVASCQENRRRKQQKNEGSEMNKVERF